MKWAGHVACMGDKRGAYRVLVDRLSGKRSLGTPRHTWEDNIKMNLQEVGGEGIAQDRDTWQALVKCDTKPQVPYNVGNSLTSRGPVSYHEELYFMESVSYKVAMTGE